MRLQYFFYALAAAAADAAAAPPKWSVDFYGDNQCLGLVGSAGGSAAASCTSVGSGGAESLDWHGGGRWAIRVYSQTSCKGSVAAVTGDSDACHIVGFKVQSYSVIGAV